MKVHVISCSVYEDGVNKILRQYSLDYTKEFFEIHKHNEPEKLKNELQERIDNLNGVDRIILLYGICGNSICGLKSRNVELYIPKIHDCSAMLLGGKEVYKEYFEDHPSTPYSCHSYMKESYDEELVKLKEKYDDETAIYLYETMYPKSANLVYIDLNHHNDKTNIEEYKKEYETVEVIKGSMKFLERVLLFKSDEKEVLKVESNKLVKCIYDLDEVIKSE